MWQQNLIFEFFGEEWVAGSELVEQLSRCNFWVKISFLLTSLFVHNSKHTVCPTISYTKKKKTNTLFITLKNLVRRTRIPNKKSLSFH